MTKLGVLRQQLASLRRARQTARAVAALAAPCSAALWALGLLWALDFVFELTVFQRAIMVLVAAAGVGVAFCLFAWPLLSIFETDLEMALLVERQQKIESDLVAALQFESPAAAAWGSRQLEEAVVDYVSTLGGELNVFEGFSRAQMVTRGLLLAITATVFVGAVLLFPGHASVFLNRLLLGSRHYPSRTVIELVAVNADPVLVRASGQDTSPLDVKCAQGLPLEFYVQCSGVLPEKGEARLAALGSGTARQVELKKLPLAQRRARLEEAAARLQAALENAEIETKGPWTTEMAAMLRFDAPQAAESLASAVERGALSQALAETQAALSAWPGEAEQKALYVGRLNRLANGVSYKLYLGDAWTDSATVAMIPLPVVESALDVVVPEYARAALQKPVDPSARQISVLEGSRVAVSIECTNKKPLAEAWLTAKVRDETTRHALERIDGLGHQWGLPLPAAPAFARVEDEIRFEIQVTDEDGLHLESPIQGQIRLRPDRPPTASASVVHKVVLPTARPRVEFRANDDYGLAQLLLHTTVERQAKPTPGEPEKPFPFGETPPTPVETSSPPEEGPLEPAEKQTTVLNLPGGRIVSPNLPYSGYHDFHLASLNLPLGPLVKGDRLKLTLEVVDYRGRETGVSSFSDPLVLEISDESGVLAAISEADARSEEKLSDIIKQQLGIGESP